MTKERLFFEGPLHVKAIFSRHDALPVRSLIFPFASIMHPVWQWRGDFTVHRDTPIEFSDEPRGSIHGSEGTVSVWFPMVQFALVMILIVSDLGAHATSNRHAIVEFTVKIGLVVCSHDALAMRLLVAPFSFVMNASVESSTDVSVKNAVSVDSALEPTGGSAVGIYRDTRPRPEFAVYKDSLGS